MPSDHAAATPRSTPPPSGRTQILRAALEEFATFGLDGASTGRIAKNAGVTQPLIHHHFGTKVDLWKASVDEAFGEFEAVHGPLLDALAGLDAATRVRIVMRHLVLYTTRRPELLRILVRESSRDDEPIRYAIDKHLRPLAMRVGLMIDEAVSGGEVRSLDIRLVAMLGMGAASHLALVPVQAKQLFKIDVTDPTIAERYADLVVDVLLNGLKTPDTSASEDNISGVVPKARRRSA